MEISGAFTINGGTINVGLKKTSNLTINGGNFTFAAGEVVIGGIFHMKNSATTSLSGNAILKINSISTLSNGNELFYVPGGSKFNVTSGSNVQIILMNGNGGSGKEVYYRPDNNGFIGGTFKIQNDNNQSKILFFSDQPIHKVVSDVGSGDTLVFVSGCDFVTDFTINSGKATIASGAGVSFATTSLGADDSLMVESGGSAIFTSSHSYKVKIERDITAWTNAAHGWHFLSSPVASQAIQPEFVPTSPTTSEDFYKWDETLSSNNWINTKDASGNWNTSFESDFVVGRGYLVAYATTQTKTFSGIVKVSDVDTTGLTYTSTSPYTGWHLLGNPFSSALLWNKTSWNLTNIDAGAKIWDEALASYTDISTGGIIPAMNGFMVHVSSAGTGSLTIDADDRTHDSKSWYKSTGGDSIVNELVVTAVDPIGSTAQKSIIKIIEDATSTGFDTQYDSRFLAGYAPQFYSVTDGIKLSTNALPELTAETVIPFGFVKNQSTDFYIQFEGIDNLNPQEKVYLRDIKTGNTQLLNENPRYDFTSNDGDDPARFELFFGPTGVEENIALKPFNIYSARKAVNIVNSNSNISRATVNIYNIAGQLIKTVEMNQQNRIAVDLSQYEGIFVVSVNNGSEIQNQKIIIY